MIVPSPPLIASGSQSRLTALPVSSRHQLWPLQTRTAGRRVERKVPSNANRSGSLPDQASAAVYPGRRLYQFAVAGQ